MADFLNRWAVSMASGGNPLILPGSSAFPAVASADGKHSIVCLTHQVRVYFLQTRQCIRTVDVDLSAVVAVHLDPGSDSRLVLFTPSSVFYVNWKEKVDNPIVASQQLSPPIPNLTDVFKVTDSTYYAVSTDGKTRVHVIDRETAATSTRFSTVSGHFAVSREGQWLAAVHDSDVALYDISAVVGDMEDPRESVQNSKESFTLSNRNATCVAVSDSGVVAVGTQAGVIHVFYGGAQTGKPHRKLKWHVDPVSCMAFSADDTYLVSGGSEKVLVFWHLDSDQNQFLPRLAGPIEKVFVDRNRPDHYSVALRVTGDRSDRAHELLTISGVDLISRLSVSPLCPNFAVPVGRAVAVASKKQKQPRAALVHDITAPVAVHPTTRHLYYARGPSIQAYDVVKGEQAFVQHAAPQISTGRVKSEHAIADPTVSAVAFTHDGQWMATFDSMPTSDFDNLMSENDVAHALKFWFWRDSSWVLASKVVDPHGVGLAVGAIVGHSGHTFTTVDTNGGVRVWKSKLNHVGSGPANGVAKGNTQTVWTLRRASAPSASRAPVALCYSDDDSLLVVSHGASVRMYDPASLQVLPASLPPMDSPVESLSIVGSYLAVASQSKILSYDMISGGETPFFAQISAPGIGNLVATDPANGLVAVVVNYLKRSGAATAKILIFRPNALSPLYTARHSSPIASLAYTSSGFLFVDTNSRIGVVAPELKQVGDSAEDNLAEQMNKMLVTAQAAANVLYSRAVDERTQTETDETDKWTAQKTIDVAVLQPLFANVEGVSLDSLFERVVRAIQ